MSDDPGEAKTFTQDDLERVISKRTKSLRADIAEREKTIAALTKDRDEYKVLSEGKDALTQQLKDAEANLQAREGRWGSEKALMGVLGDKYDDDVAEVLIRKHAGSEGAPGFAEWAQAQAEERAGMFGLLLGGKEAEPTPNAPGGLPPKVPATPPAPKVNGGAGSVPPAAPAFTRGGVAGMDADSWASLKAQMGVKPR